MKTLFLSLLTSLISLSAFAQNIEQQKILQMNDRPSPEVILSNPALLENMQPSGFDRNAFKTNIPTLIVSLEKAFPGGTYAFLGRDMDLVADAVEAFYLSVGQTDRVVRIKISTPSLQNASQDIITDYLIHLGLDAKPKSHKPPMVMVDYTSFGTSSQSTRITYAVLQELLKRGLPANDILTRFNVASIHGGIAVDTINTVTTSQEGLQKKLELQNRNWVDNGKIDRIIRVPLNSVAYGSEWHDTYGPLHKNGRGPVTTTPSRYFNSVQKVPVLSNMIAAIKLASSPIFQKEVWNKAVTHGVTIAGLQEPIQAPRKPPMTPEEKQAKAEAKIAKLNQDFKDSVDLVTSQLTALPEKFEYSKVRRVGGKITLTENGLALLNALDSETYYNTTRYLETSLDVLVREYEAGKIGTRDFRRIFIHILENKQITDPDFVKAFQANYKKFYPLEITIGKPEFREKYLALSGTAGLNYKKLVDGGAMPLSCKFLLLSAAE
jgi:hypothetical protein